jgi:hypothetical protein
MLLLACLASVFKITEIAVILVIGVLVMFINLGRVAELQFLRFRRPHDPHVSLINQACISACSHMRLVSHARHRWKLLPVHCGHSSSSALNLHVCEQSPQLRLLANFNFCVFVVFCVFVT